MSDGGQPFQASTTAPFAPNVLVSDVNLVTVPQGKRLVIEYISALGVVPTGQRVRVNIRIITSGRFGTHALPLIPQGSFSGFDNFSASLPVRLYADPGTLVSGEASRDAGTGNGSLTLSISGYLVTV